LVAGAAVLISACAAVETPEPLPEGAERAIDRAVTDTAHFIGEATNPLDPALYAALATYDDPRIGWVVLDLGQFVYRGEPLEGLVATANRLMGEDYTPGGFWLGLGNRLITDDVPAPPGLVAWKRELYGAANPTFVHLVDESADVDWRHVTFGGVHPDDRPFGSTDTCFCIPALDLPPSVPAAEGDWYPDELPVLGIEVNGEARAYPLNIMEAHELVNDELGGRPISLTYCTLCRSAVAFALDELPEGVERPVLRTSGLLQRSNKLVFDRETYSLIDQFTGEALSGPLAEVGVVLPRLTVVTSSWQEWRAAHPDTTLMAGKNGNGPNYPLDPLGDRDARGPIFPIGAVDDTLFASQQVVGTILEDGSTVAFAIDELEEAVAAGITVTHRGVTVVADGSGFRLVDDKGRDLRSSEATWFAWSQHFATTDLWRPGTDQG
jgi:hypothetical protein